MLRIKLLFLLFLLPLAGFSQYTHDIHLSKKLDESRLGFWQQGDYKVYVKMDNLENRYRLIGNQYLETIRQNVYPDSVHSLYLLTANRYLQAADELKKAKAGFDLRKLVVYYGLNDETQNTESSLTVEYDVRMALESGEAAVYKKEERIYLLKSQTQSSDKGITGMDITIYHDSIENYIFKYYHDYGW